MKPFPKVYYLSIQALMLSHALSSMTPSAFAEESHPGLGMETRYSEAVLAFNKRQMNEALRILDEILKDSPRHLEALELKALTLKAKGDEVRSMEVYKNLIRVKPKEETGSYHFELGVLYNKQKKFGPARTHFERAIEFKVNEVPSHFFLGMIAFNGGELKRAEKHFVEAEAGKIPDMKMAATYFLGLIYFKQGSVSRGTDRFVQARKLARELKESPMAKDIREGADKILSPFDKSRWFSSLTLLGQYDSNVTQQSISSGAASENATPKLMFTGLGGWMSSPAGALQWVFSYRASYNKNFNSNTSAYEFFSNVPSLYLNFFSLSPVSYGLKLEGSYTFQNQSPTRSFGPYSMGGEAGAFLKVQMESGTQFSADASYKPTRYVEDSSLNGNIMTTHAAVKQQSSLAWFNPGLTASFESNPAESTEYRYQAMGAGVTDQWLFSQKDTLNISADYLSTNYAESSTARKDQTLTFRMNWTRLITKNFSVLTDLSYIKNSSSLSSTYTYDRYMVGTGISWNL